MESTPDDATQKGEVIEKPVKSDDIEEIMKIIEEIVKVIEDNEDEEPLVKKYLYVDPIGSQFTVTIKIRDNYDPLNVSQDLLLENSKYFQKFYSTPNTQLVEDLTDFDPDVVILFITFLADKHIADSEEKDFSIGDIEEKHFRGLHKLSIVLQVEWMVIQCEECFISKIKEMEEVEVETWDDFEGFKVLEEIHRYEAELLIKKKYLLDECIFIIKTFKKERLLQVLAQEISLHDNREFLSTTLKDCQQYNQNELKFLLEAGNHDVNLFLEIILQNLEDLKSFNKNIRFLLDNLDMKLFVKLHNDKFDVITQTIQSLPGVTLTRDDYKFLFDITLRASRPSTTISICSNTEQLVTTSTGTNVKIERNTLIWDYIKYREIKDKHRPQCLDDVVKIVREEECVDSMCGVLCLVDYLDINNNNITLSDNAKFIEDLTKSSIKPVHNGVIMDFISKISNTDCNNLVNTIKDNDTLCVDEGVKVLVGFKKTGDCTVGYTLYYKYSDSSCTLQGECGVIVKMSKSSRSQKMRKVTGMWPWVDYLSTDKHEYDVEELHLHDEIDAGNMVLSYGKLYLTTPTITSVDVGNNEAQSTTMVASVDVGSQTQSTTMVTSVAVGSQTQLW